MRRIARGGEMRPVRISLQRSENQKAAEAKENLDAELAEILAEARHLRFRQSGEIEMVAEQNEGSRAEADEVIAVFAARFRPCGGRGDAVRRVDFRWSVQWRLSRNDVIRS